MFFEPRSKGLKAIQRRVGGSKAIATISASFETLEPRQCCTANDDVFTKTAADFGQSADPNKNLVTALDVMANDTANSGNKAHLSIGVVTFIGPTGGGTISKPTQTVYMPNGGYIQTIQDGQRITGIRYGLPTQAILSADAYNQQERRAREEFDIWCDGEREAIGHYYDNVNLVLNRIGSFVRDHTGAGSGGFGSGGSSLKDILGLKSIGISPGPGVVLSIGGRAIDFLLGSYAKNQLATLDDAILGAFQEASDARRAEVKQFEVEKQRLLDDFDLSLSKVEKRVFGNFSFVYTEVDGSPITNQPPPPTQLGGVMVNPAAASVKTSSSATVAVNMNIEDYSAKLAQLNAWRASHSLTSHRYDQELGGTLNDMYGDALIAFSNRMGFNVAWENGQWVGQDRHSAMEPDMWQSGGEYGSGVMLIRLYTFDGFDIADELNKIKYKKR